MDQPAAPPGRRTGGRAAATARRTVVEVEVDVAAEPRPGLTRRPAALAVEEPLEIRVGGPRQRAVAVATTMRTPGSDFELATGFLLAEGVLHGPDDVHEVRYCDGRDDDGVQHYNVVSVRTRTPVDVVARVGTVTSSCGVCGAASLASLAACSAPLAPSVATGIDVAVLLALPDAMRGAQRLFARTGAVHAASLAAADGTLLVTREDIGRHNAVDKVIGAELLAGRAPSARAVALVVSGRASYEIVQKAVRARLACVVAVSAPTSLAAEAAEHHGVTLIGFARGGRATVYTHASRLAGL